MKRKNILNLVVMAAFLALGMLGCQDTVLVPVANNKPTDSVLALIADANNQLITLDKNNNTLTLSNAELEKQLISLNAQYQSLLDAQDQGSTPTQVHLTINVLSTAGTIFSNGGRVSGLTGATVTVSQNGNSLSPSSSGAGLYLFKGLFPGEATVQISAPNHASALAKIWLYISDGEDDPTADAYNAATQIVLFPTSGPKAGHLKGYAYANTSTLNDTLSRKYGSNATAFGGKANTTLTSPSMWEDYYNYTQYNSPSDNSYSNMASLYNSYPSGGEVQFEMAPTGTKIYATPNLDHFDINWDDNLNGYITQLTYIGLTTSTTVAADGSFDLAMAAHSSYDNPFFDDMVINLDRYVDNHTRLTKLNNYFNGELNETGSSLTTFKFYNNSNGDQYAATVTTGNPTISIASPGVVTLSAHGLAVDDLVIFNTTGALPTGISAGTTYYVIAGVTANTFSISTTSGGAAVNTTGTQSGVHTLTAFKKVTAAHAVSVSRRTVTESWWYVGSMIDDGSLYWNANDNSTDDDLSLSTIPQSGQTLNSNIYFFPRDKNR